MKEKWFRYRTADDDLGILFHELSMKLIEEGILIGDRILSRDEGFDIFDKEGSRLYEHDYITFLDGTYAEILLVDGIITIKNFKYCCPFKIPWQRIIQKVGNIYTREDLKDAVYGKPHDA